MLSNFFFLLKYIFCFVWKWYMLILLTCVMHVSRVLVCVYLQVDGWVCFSTIMSAVSLFMFVHSFQPFVKKK